MKFSNYQVYNIFIPQNKQKLPLLAISPAGPECYRLLRMARFSNEFQVGLLSIVAVTITAWGVTRIDDRPDGSKTYNLTVTFPSVDGVYPDTPVKVAGVPVGAVDRVELTGGTATLTLNMQGDVQLPVDTLAELKADGILGDKLIRLSPGKAAEFLKEGDVLTTSATGSELDALKSKAESIADDVKVITANLRSLTSDQELIGRTKNILTNIDGLSTDLRKMAADNRSELTTIARNLLEVSSTLKAVIEATGANVETEMKAVKAATEALQRTLGNVESITAKIDRGEGTIGQLVNDDTSMETVNATLKQVNGVVDQVGSLVNDVTRIQTDVYYRGDVYFGSDPHSGDFNQNPMSGSVRNVLGIKIQPKENSWYDIGLVSNPLGNISYEDHYLPGSGSSYREYVSRPDYRFTFQFARQFHHVVMRFGLKESSGGVGVDVLALHDRLSLSADLYDFTYGSWPVLDGTPNLQLNLRVNPWHFLYVEGGADNVILGAQHGYFTGFIGGGFTFNDQDLRVILPAVPSP